MASVPSSGSGVIRLFRFAGIDVFLHWSWFLVAMIEIGDKSSRYSSLLWNTLEYLALFAIVLLPEFGHSLACRQVGGTADRIVLWPLGGVAFVSPPPRPGATLWSITAGPLVNVVLYPVLAGLLMLSQSSGWFDATPDAYRLLNAIWYINAGLLIFNLLPIYPLDGGQILQSLLWFVMGRGRSLMVATIIGFIGVAGIILLALKERSMWIGIIAGFILLNCWGGFRQAMAHLRLAKMPRRAGFACPACKAKPLAGAFWGCGNCRQAFDTFETRGECPHCGTQFDVMRCPECGASHPISAWASWTPPPPIGGSRRT
ncbi:MAG: site-2 protease family protein [Chloroflexi bacterium]|nr:site-2 protease family protein [Chloroflexota bacterium]